MIYLLHLDTKNRYTYIELIYLLPYNSYNYM